MRLHELEKGKVYIGEDNKEYKVEDRYLLYFDNGSRRWERAAFVSRHVQNFTPKKVKRVVEVRGWLNKYPVGRCDCYYATKEEADLSASISRIACVEMKGSYEIEVEE